MAESFNWDINWEIYKYKTDSVEIVRQGLIEPYDILTREGNMLMYKGSSAMWQYMLGNGTSVSNNTLSFFNNAHSYIAVGTSTAGVLPSQTSLQAGAGDTSRVFKAMESGFPQHTDANSEASQTISFKSIFDSSSANFAWNEWGIFNGTAVGSRMLNRKSEYLGTKEVGETWTFIINIKLS